MKALIPAYLATFATMLVLDFAWLGVIAAPVYKSGIGHLMADSPNIGFAAVFYVIYTFGLMRFGVLRSPGSRSWKVAAAGGAWFGFFVYATYDLTNLALLRDWPVGMSVMDMVWGTFVSGASAAAGKLAYRPPPDEANPGAEPR